MQGMQKVLYIEAPFADSFTCPFEGSSFCLSGENASEKSVRIAESAAD